MTALYQLTTRCAALKAIAESTELPEDEASKLLEELHNAEIATTEKITGVAMAICNMETDADAIEAAAKRMAERAKRIKANSERLRRYLLENMQQAEISKVSCEWFEIKLRKSPASVKVIDESKIPADYMRVPEVKPAPDKRKILDAFKTTGEIVDGCEIMDNLQTVEIK